MRALIVGLAIAVSVPAFAQSNALGRGQAVRTKAPTSANEGVTAVQLIVVATPGDRLRTDEARLYVNDVVVGGFSTEFMRRVAEQPERVPTVLPAGHYFVMGEQRINRDITEYWGIHPEGRLESVR
jgi:hypothetical protein